MTFMDRFTSVRDDVRGAFVGYAGRMTQASVCKMQNTIAQKDRHSAHVIASDSAAIHKSIRGTCVN